MSISDCVFRSNSVLSALSIIDDFLMKSKLISSLDSVNKFKGLMDRAKDEK